MTLLNPEDLPFRPIVAGPNCPTSRLSNLIDIILKPLISHVTSYIRDSTDFLAKLPITVPNETLLATYDVVSLHTNIPHDLRLTVVKYWLDKYPDSINQWFLCIPFLHIIIYKEGTEIKTDIYHKPTDTFLYLHYYYYHPRHTKNNIPFNLARRVCTIVSDPVRKQQRLLELKDQLIQRKYPDTLVYSSIIKAENIPRGELLKKHPKRDKSRQHNNLSTYI